MEDIKQFIYNDLDRNNLNENDTGTTYGTATMIKPEKTPPSTELNDIQPDLTNADSSRPSHLTNKDSEKNNSSKSNKMTYDEYVKKAESDQGTLLKVIFFVAFIIVMVLSFYHLFWGSNGHKAQRVRAFELSRMKEIEKSKEEELLRKLTLLEKIKHGDVETLEKLAREKGYIYEDETIIKMPSMEKQKDLTMDNEIKLDSAESNTIKYLIISLTMLLSIIAISLVVNHKHKKV